jgi:hypothetical protein
MHRSEVSQIALHDLGAELTQSPRAVILPANQSAHPVSFGEQHLGQVTAY